MSENALIINWWGEKEAEPTFEEANTGAPCRALASLIKLELRMNSENACDRKLEAVFLFLFHARFALLYYPS